MQISDRQIFPVPSLSVQGGASPFAVSADGQNPHPAAIESGQGDFTVSLSSKSREMSAALQEGRGKETASGVSSGTSHNSGTDKIGSVGAVECQTCKSRRYKDDSNDSSVSFQTATRIAPGAEESAVRAHEQEHVSHEQTKAKESGGEVVSQNVSIHYQICPECGRMYVSGGTTTTVTRSCGDKGQESGASGDNGRKGLDAWA
jgi:hypothetical protein